MLSDPWVLDRFTSVEVTEGQNSRKTDHCFSTSGFLHRTRIRRAGDGRSDVLAVFTQTATGEVATEAYYGGDLDETPGNPDLTRLPLNFETCNGTLPTVADYRLTHTYSHGVRSQTSYDGTFDVLDLTIDASTGLPSESRDTAGVVTSYVYDVLGRLTQQRPAGDAWTEYTYDPVNTAVTAVQRGSAGTVQMELRYHYDGLGRLVQESRRMPGAKWATIWSRYDEFGRKVAVTTARETPDGTAAPYPDPAGYQTLWSYDTLGRVTTVTAPDAKETKFSYPDPRTTVRTTKVGTAVAVGGTVTTSDVAVTEKTDGAGRLVEVIENGDSTTYGYDLDDRLTKVIMGDQERSFEYDGAGFLKKETHPENGTTEFQYDARGHLIRRNPALPDPQGTLRYVYDSAERLGTVFNGTGAPVKKFEYYAEEVDGQNALGKLRAGTRYNRHRLLGTDAVEVREEYTYAGRGGRLSRKKTLIGPSSQPRQTFTDEYQYDDLGGLSNLTYPACEGCKGLITPERKIGFVRDSGLLTQVEGYTTGTGITYHRSGMVKSIRHRNSDGNPGPLYTVTEDAEMGRPASLQVSNYCSAAGTLNVTTSPASTANLPLHANVTISVQASGTVTSWHWY